MSLLGGGGFFVIGISSEGVNEIEAALEFGAAIAIDLGVASGGVEIKAGVYFHWLETQPDKGSVDLSGYVRLHGELSRARHHLRVADLQPAALLPQGDWPGVDGLGRGHARDRDRGAPLQRVGLGPVPEGLRRIDVRSEVHRARARPGDVGRVLRRVRRGGCVMARQSFMWTTLPNGYTPDGSALRVSVMLSPRLDPQAQPEVLASFFPDWADWPATLTGATMKITIGAGSVSVPLTQTTGPNRVDLAYGGPDSAVWKALFAADLFVRPYAYQDLSNNDVLSFDTVHMSNIVRSVYSLLAANANGNMPKVSDIVDNPRWSRLTDIVAVARSRGVGPQDRVAAAGPVSSSSS